MFLEWIRSAAVSALSPRYHCTPYRRLADCSEVPSCLSTSSSWVCDSPSVHLQFTWQIQCFQQKAMPGTKIAEAAHPWHPWTRDALEMRSTSGRNELKDWWRWSRMSSTPRSAERLVEIPFRRSQAQAILHIRVRVEPQLTKLGCPGHQVSLKF